MILIKEIFWRKWIIILFIKNIAKAEELYFIKREKKNHQHEVILGNIHYSFELLVFNLSYNLNKNINIIDRLHAKNLKLHVMHIFCLNVFYNRFRNFVMLLKRQGWRAFNVFAFKFTKLSKLCKNWIKFYFHFLSIN